MDYTAIETFLAIAETRSLSKAAEVLFFDPVNNKLSFKIP